MPSKSVLPKPTVIVRKKRPQVAPSALEQALPTQPASSPMKLRAAAAKPSRSSKQNPEPQKAAPLSLLPSEPAPPASTTAASLPARQHPPRKERERQQRQELLTLLQQRWPALFPVDIRQRKPLAVGIHHELIAALPEVKPWRIRQFLGWWQWSGKGAYWRALLKGGVRYRLDGAPSGCVTPQEQAHARQKLAAFDNKLTQDECVAINPEA